MIKLCPYCIQALESRGERVFVVDIVHTWEETEENTICGWCDEKCDELFTCEF